MRHSKRLCLLAVVCAIFACGFSTRALTIVPTFDSSITSDPNVVAIESTINAAILLYEKRFSDPITVTILFEEATTAGEFGTSQSWYYVIPYSEFRSALQQDATTAYDTVALAHLPSGSANPVTGNSFIRVKTANLRAVGIFGFNSGLTNGVDGIIGLDTAELNLSRPAADPNKGDLLATVEHEMDEVLGLASALDAGGITPFPEDLFRYTAEGSRSFTTSGDDAYFSIDGTSLLARFNQMFGADYGDWWYAGPHTSQVQDASATVGAMPNPRVELIALEVIGYNLVPAPVPGITRARISGTQLTLNVTNGLAGGTYLVLYSTNLTTPRSQWTPLATNYLTVNGNFSVTILNALNSSQPRRFFALELQ